MARKTFFKKITTPELIAQINIENQKIVNRFIKNFDTKRSDASVKVYKSNFNIFFCWNIMHNDNKFFVDIRKSEFMDFFDYAVSELKWSPNRYAQMWSSLSSLSNYIENILDDDYPMFRNQIKKIEKLPKNTVRKKTVLSDEQVTSLISHLESDGKLQEACFLALACYSGARISEIFRFRVDVISEDNVAFDGLFLETTEEIKTKGYGKLGSMKYKYIYKKPFIQRYNNWLVERQRIMDANEISHNMLFIRSDGSPAGIAITNSWIDRWEKYLTSDINTNPKKEEIHIYAHSFRHYLCTMLSRIGLEQEFIIELFGWATADMYNIYNDLTAKDKKFASLEKLKNLQGD